jgi:8-oxo-dGTP pyrophosphatase MutT (NUDIX family)
VGAPAAATPVTALVARVAGRALLVDGDSRVLMINEAIDAGQAYWLTPGGGIEPGETPQQAAMRETYEETGLVIWIPADAVEVHRERRTWSYRGTNYDQINYFFAVRVPEPLDMAPAALTDMERKSLIGFRWWPAAELRASDELFYPPEIADLVDAFTSQPKDG